MTINGRAKGASAERELAELLTAWAVEVGVVLDLKRNLEQVRGGGHDLVGLEPYGMAVEVKRVEQLSIPAWWRQACQQAEAVGCTPVLAWRQNRKPWSFRIRAWLYPCSAQLDADLEASHFKNWYQAKILAK